MKTIFIVSNETGEVVDFHNAPTNDECEAWANEMYGSNDYTWSYTAREDNEFNRQGK